MGPPGWGAKWLAPQHKTEIPCPVGMFGGDATMRNMLGGRAATNRNALSLKVVEEWDGKTNGLRRIATPFRACGLRRIATPFRSRPPRAQVSGPALGRLGGVGRKTNGLRRIATPFRSRGLRRIATPFGPPGWCLGGAKCTGPSKRCILRVADVVSFWLLAWICGRHVYG